MSGLYRYFITASKDMTARLYTLHPLEGYKPKTFAGHRDALVGAFFSEDEKSVSLPLFLTVSERADLLLW